MKTNRLSNSDTCLLVMFMAVFALLAAALPASAWVWPALGAVDVGVVAFAMRPR